MYRGPLQLPLADRGGPLHIHGNMDGQLRGTNTGRHKYNRDRNRNR